MILTILTETPEMLQALSGYIITILMVISIGSGIALFGSLIYNYFNPKSESEIPEPFDFGSNLYFLDNAMYNKFQVVKGTVFKRRKEEITTANNKIEIKYSYKLKLKKGYSDFIGGKLLSSDVNDVLLKLNILGDVKAKYNA